MLSVLCDTVRANKPCQERNSSNNNSFNNNHHDDDDKSSGCSSNHHNAHGKMIHATCGLRAKRACMHSLPYVIVESRHHSLVQSDTQKEKSWVESDIHTKKEKKHFIMFLAAHTHTHLDGVKYTRRRVVVA